MLRTQAKLSCRMKSSRPMPGLTLYDGIKKPGKSALPEQEITCLKRWRAVYTIGRVKPMRICDSDVTRPSRTRAEIVTASHLRAHRGRMKAISRSTKLFSAEEPWPVGRVWERRVSNTLVFSSPAILVSHIFVIQEAFTSQRLGWARFSASRTHSVNFCRLARGSV